MLIVYHRSTTFPDKLTGVCLANNFTFHRNGFRSQRLSKCILPPFLYMVFSCHLSTWTILLLFSSFSSDDCFRLCFILCVKKTENTILYYLHIFCNEPQILHCFKTPIWWDRICPLQGGTGLSISPGDKITKENDAPSGMI